MTDNSADRLRGRVALVTGGGRGIGRAVALGLAARGAAVAVLARSAPEVEAVAAEIRAAGGRAMAISADVSDPESVARAFAQIAAELGPVEILINNAAVVAPIGPLAESDPGAWTRALRINLEGPYLCTRAALPAMRERGWGRVVNITSGAAHGRGIPNGSAYSVSKAGLDMLTRACAAELAGSGVTVNAVSPGVVDTQMQADIRGTPVEQIGADTLARFTGFYERGELRAADAPAALIVALAASEHSGEIVGMESEIAAQLLA